MSLDNIQLPPFLIQELYSNSLVEEDNKQLKTKSLKKDDIPFLGNNERNILLIVENKDVMYLPDEDLAFLAGILNACKLSLSDTALLNVSRTPELNYESLQKKFTPRVILFFGTDPTKLDFPLRFPNYQVQSYNNQTLLCAPALHELTVDREQKALLWAALKTIFSI